MRQIKQVGGNHYGHLKYDTWDLAMDTAMPFSQASAIKYIVQAPYKGTTLLDIGKARGYIQGMAKHDQGAAAPIPEYGPDYIQHLSQCTEKFIDQLALSGSEITAIRELAQVHILDRKSRARVFVDALRAVDFLEREYHDNQP